MIILYSGEKIISFIADNHKSPLAEYSNYIEIDEISENQDVIGDIIREQRNEWDIFSIINGQLFRNGVLVPIITDLDKERIRNEYITSQENLQTIIDTPQSPAPSNAQLLTAIKVLARILKLVLRYFARNV